MEYKQFIVQAFEREPGKWRASVERANGKALMITTKHAAISSLAPATIIGERGFINQIGSLESKRRVKYQPGKHKHHCGSKHDKLYFHVWDSQRRIGFD